MKQSIKESLKSPAVEVCLGKQLWSVFLTAQGELSQRVAKMRRNFAKQYGFVIPDIKLSDDLSIGPKGYQIKIYGAIASAHELRLGQRLIVVGSGKMPDLPGEEATDPAFGVPAMWIPEGLAEEAKRLGFTPVDPVSVLLTHISEVLRNNLSQLLVI